MPRFSILIILVHAVEFLRIATMHDHSDRNTVNPFADSRFAPNREGEHAALKGCRSRLSYD